MGVSLEGVVDDSIVRLVDYLINRAIELEASDIHLEVEAGGLRVRYRLDGVLQDQAPVSTNQMWQVIGRLKVLARLDLAENRIPQDGKFRHVSNLAQVDLRVSTFPGVLGEKMVLRILDQKHHNISLDRLGLDSKLYQNFLNLIQRSHGFILVTGPTGSGKTTTLYAALKQLHAPDKNIITLEDPVEYYLTGITQGQIYPKAGFSFAKGIRALLRQDPDVAMIGEIRDSESARIAIEAALTGHVVFSTLHTNDAPSAVVRLMEMGIEPFLLNAAISGIMAQRLVRKLCEKCKLLDQLTTSEQTWLQEQGCQLGRAFRPVGCDFCYQTGYRGRVGVFELLQFTDDLRALINRQPRLSEIYQQAAQDGMTSFKIDALSKLQAGVTSLEEVVALLRS
jgi:type II secretory ATPase GspE/PulE/Tfp pilus assembly ATPase PilB-like protein